MASKVCRALPEWLPRLLLEHSTKKYYMEYDSFLSNHLAHGIIALAKLGFPEARANRFINWYVHKLEPPVNSKDAEDNPGQAAVEESELAGLLGARKSFYGLRKYYEKKLDEYGSMEMLIQKSFPGVAQGLAATLLHALIHLGYGYSVRDRTITLEGIAYLHFNYRPLEFDAGKPENDLNLFGKGDTDIRDVIKEIVQDQSLWESTNAKAEVLLSEGFHQGRGQLMLAGLLKHGDILIKYVNKIAVPKPSEGENIVNHVANWLLDQIIFVFAAAETKNDFVLLHGVTSAWSLREIIGCLKPEDALFSMRTYACIMLAAFLIHHDAPELDPTFNVDDVEVSDENWQRVIEDAVAKDVDEHFYKLVQVCHDRWLENKESVNSRLYLKASRSCVDNEIHLYVRGIKIK